jgi:DNA-binding transcriptional MerR regulator
MSEPAAGPPAGISSGALARRLGVSPTTLRSWDRRYDLGPADRQQGRHRRWTPQDVAMVEDMCRLTAEGVPPAEAARLAQQRAATGGAPPAVPAGRPRASAPAGLPLGKVRRECRGLARAALRLESPSLEEQLTAFVRQHGIEAAWEELMMPTLHAVGRKWETAGDDRHGDRYVEVEHLLSWHVSTALRTAPLLLGPPAAERPGAPALLACVPGEQHTLPLEALHAALRHRGRPARMLGAALPADALVAAVRRTGPAHVVLWSQTRSAANPALAAHLGQETWGVKGARQRATLVLAGPGWRGTTVRGALRPGGLREALGLLDTDAQWSQHLPTPGP